MRVELTTEQKWAEVDRRINAINLRRAKGEVACLSGLDEYLDLTFNPVRQKIEAERAERAKQILLIAGK